jgi:hypothetical protein
MKRSTPTWLQQRIKRAFDAKPKPKRYLVCASRSQEFMDHKAKGVMRSPEYYETPDPRIRVS